MASTSSHYIVEAMDDLRQAWERDGYVVLQGIATQELIAGYAEELAVEREGLLVRGIGDEHVSLATSVQPAGDGVVGAVDPFALSVSARALLLSPDLVEFLAAQVLYGDAALLFDAVEASAGAPEDGPFRDATYVAVAAEPEVLVTATVALDGGAAVTLFPGSHKITTAPFGGRYRHYNAERDGAAALQRHRDELAAGLGGEPARKTITLKPGDAVVWGADLVHVPVTGRALVAHLCPVRVGPSWFTYRPERARVIAHADGAAWMASQHYDRVDAVALEDLPGVARDGKPQVGGVEQALREHDEVDASQSPPAPASGRRGGGGLVGSVRGLMRRRGRAG